MAKNLIGHNFGRLAVLGKSENRNKECRRLWICSCSCGNLVCVDTKSLTTGSTTSCGCYRREKHKRLITKHGESKSKLYYVWNDMKSRCTDTNADQYKDYGGRGISVCDEWKSSYEAFRDWAIGSGYVDGLTLDRIDVNGDYNQSNCRWVNMKTQSNNKRNNRVVKYNGQSHTISEWSELTGIRKETLLYRINAGWDIHEAMTRKPIRGGHYGT